MYRVVPSSLLEELGRKIRGEIRLDRATRILYSTDASIHRIEPLAVAFPKDEDDLLEITDKASREGIPVIPRGSGTGLAGQALGRGIVIEMSGLCEPPRIDPEGRTAFVTAGTRLGDLNRLAGPRGLTFGPDPTSADRATIGGVIANNATGARSIVYGFASDHVESLRVLLSGGFPGEGSSGGGGAEIIEVTSKHASDLDPAHSRVDRAALSVREKADLVNRTFPRHWRRVSGYNLPALLGEKVDLPELFFGSEGTLGIVLSAVLSLVEIPRDSVMVILPFGGMDGALREIPSILETGPSMVELVDEKIMGAARSIPALKGRLGFVKGDPAALLLVSYEGDPACIGSAAADCAASFAGASVIEDRDEQNNVMEVRKHGLGLLMSVKGRRKPVPFIEDCAVPPERLKEFVSGIESIVRSHGTEAAYYAHASAGCLHIRPLLDIAASADIERMASISSETADLVLSLGGAMSGEHGDGLSRSYLTERFFGGETVALFRGVKSILDPAGIMNPGKIIDSPPLTASLRTAGEERPLRVDTVIDWGALGWDEGDSAILEATRQCNGDGVCLLDEGVMCPSYQVLKDEMHSTRGRANLLREVLSGRLPPEEWGGDLVHEALDLCLACKGCAGECPSLVDISLLKAEFLHARNRKFGTPLRSRLIGGVNSAARIGSIMPGVAGLLTGMVSGLLGFHPSRRPPRPAGRRFTSSPSARAAGRGDGIDAVLFADTFTEYFEPSIGEALLRISAAAGLKVLPVKPGCCGRPQFSKGLLDKAAQSARRVVSALYRYTASGVPVIVLEPSCLSMMKDYKALLPGDAGAESLAAAAVSAEEWLLGSIAVGKVLGPMPGLKLLVHGHCHSKALGTHEKTIDLLERIPGAEVVDSGAGCCGMAGAFGYEKEHYEISMRIAEERLLPVLRERPDHLSIAAGFSCRRQIEDALGRRSFHPARIIARAVRRDSG